MNELLVPLDHESLRLIGPWITELVDTLDETTAQALTSRAELAVHELATNSVDHSNSPTDSLTLRGTLDSGALRIELSDQGDPVDLSAIPAPDPNEPRVRGYGMMIVEQLVSTLDYERIDERNVWTAVFDIPDTPPTPTDS